MKRRWRNVPGCVNGEIEIYFESTGYYDPGVLSGPPEKCYPPEGEDERTLDCVTVWVGKRSRKLSQTAADEIFEAFRSEVEDEEIDTTPDEPDHDAIREEREIRRMKEK